MSGASSIAAGYLHSLSVKGGRVYVWGDVTQTNVPTAALSGVGSVAGGGNFSLAVRTDGSLVAWGASYIATNVPASATSGVSQVAGGENHALVLKSGGIIAWGSNTYGQCDVPPELNTGVTAIGAGFHYSMALKNGGVQMFGVAATNELAFGIRDVPAAATSGVSAIAAGRWHALALKNGGVLAWGATDGTNYFSDAVLVPGDATSGVAAIAAGDLFSVALKSNGTVVVWGDSTKGQTNIPAAAATGVSQIAAGSGHVLGLCSFMPPRFLAASLPPPYLDQEYAGALNAAGNPAVSYHKFGVWPAWITLNPSTGALGGTPTNNPNVPFFFAAIASNIYGMVTNTYSNTVLVFTGPPVIYTPNPLPDGILNDYYSLQIVASNSPVFSLVEGGGSLPSGLSMNSAGLITGYPAEVQDVFFTVRATNAFGASNKVYNLSIKAPTNPPLLVTTSPLPSGVVGQIYNVQIVASNGPYFSVLSGSLPAGLGLTGTGAITGTPEQIESASFTVLATNVVGSTNRAYVLEIEGPPAFISTSPLPGGSVDVEYSQLILASGNPVFSLNAGSLPPGLGLETNGLVSGTPATAGDYNFVVLITNQYGADTRAFDIQITQVPVFVTTSPLPAGTNGSPYSLQFQATGNPLYSVVAGSLPGGLNLSAAGLLNGTANSAGNFNFTVRATNTYGWSNRVFDLSIVGWLQPSFTGIRVTNGNVRLAWTNPNAGGSIQVWRATNITMPAVPWSNLGVQVSPWTNIAPTNPSYYQLRLVP